jgi:hypothetical protein
LPIAQRRLDRERQNPYGGIFLSGDPNIWKGDVVRDDYESGAATRFFE